jgi:PIN domain nuclease of toxin-antitoxin system
MIRAAYVADAHTLAWYLSQSQKLSHPALEIFRAAERGETTIVISAIVIAELFYLNQKAAVFDDFATTYRDMKAKAFFQFADFSPDDVLDFDQDAAVSEMHDRIIVGLARRLGAPLLTTDRQITAAQVVEVVW